MVNTDCVVSLTPIIGNNPSEGTFIRTHRWAEKDFEVRESVEEIMNIMDHFMKTAAYYKKQNEI